MTSSWITTIKHSRYSFYCGGCAGFRVQFAGNIRHDKFEQL